MVMAESRFIHIHILTDRIRSFLDPIMNETKTSIRAKKKVEANHNGNLQFVSLASIQNEKALYFIRKSDQITSCAFIGQICAFRSFFLIDFSHQLKFSNYLLNPNMQMVRYIHFPDGVVFSCNQLQFIQGNLQRILATTGFFYQFNE